jgi:hypothetical protein
MKAVSSFSDYDNPIVKSKAEELTSGANSVTERVERIFYFIRDEIQFGFPPVWDRVKASETLKYGIGYCSTKATLFNALCRATDIPARIHSGLIDIRIMRGIFPAMVFPMMPASGSHSWTEIQIGVEWKPIDSYINDKAFYDAALQKLQDSGRKTGYSISLAKGASSCEFNFGEKGFVHMGAVIEDHGVWDDYSEYMSSDKYRGMSSIQLMMYPALAKLCNRNVEKIRQ